VPPLVAGDEFPVVEQALKDLDTHRNILGYGALTLEGGTPWTVH
jgi:hypothetical protein